MATEDNVVKLDPLERRARRIEAAMVRRAKGDEEWIEGTIDLAVELAGARDDHGDNDSKFGEWLKGRFGENRLPKNDRGYLIEWGRKPEEMRIELEKTESRSLRMIFGKSTFPTTGKGAEEYFTSPSKTPAEKLNAALRHAQATEALTGKLPPEKDLAVAAGVSPATANEALQIIRHNRPEDIGRVQFTKTTQAHIEALTTRRLRDLEKEFDERVRLTMLEHNREYRAVLEESKRADEGSERYEKLINNFKPIFNETEFTTILTCLHPDNVASKEKRDTAFKAFNAKKLQLTGKW